MLSHHLKGILGEFLALMILTFKGYRLKIWNWQHHIAQADLVMVKNDIFIIIEVKWRTHHHYYDGGCPIDVAQIERLQKLLSYAHAQRLMNCQDYQLHAFIIHPTKIFPFIAWQHYDV